MLKPKHLAALLALVFAMMMPTAFAFADEDTLVLEAGSASELKGQLTKVNPGGERQDAKSIVISLTGDIDMYDLGPSASLNYYNPGGELTLFGNGHTLDFSKCGEGSGMGVYRGATLNLGADDSGDFDNAITIVGTGYHGNGTPFIGVNNTSGPGTLNMYDGVTVTGAKGNNTFGGAVTVSGNGCVFNMYGGTIEKSGISGGSICFGGGVAVVSGGSFYMHDGSIRDCYLEQNYPFEGDRFRTYYDNPAGAGVYVHNDAYFEMNGGQITGNKIVSLGGDAVSGVGGGVAVMANANQRFGLVTSKFVMNGGVISENESNFAGGGIALSGGSNSQRSIGPSSGHQGNRFSDPGIEINGGQIINNSARGEGSFGGGGIFVFCLNSNVSAKINNAVLTGNSVGDGDGGAIVLYPRYTSYFANASISNCTIVGNTAAYGGGISCVGAGNGNCTAAFDADAPSTIYGNSASVGADDVFSDGSSLIGLPDWDEMTPLPAEGEAVTRLHGWKWDVENGDSHLDYNGQSIPMKRYDSSGPYAYEPIDTETQLVYLKMVSDTVVFRTVTPIMDGKVMDENIQKVISGQSCGDITFTPEKGKEIVSVKVNGKKVDFKLERDGSYIFKSTVIDEDTTIEVETQAIPGKPDDPEDPDKPSDPDKPDTPDDPDEPDTPTGPDKPSDPGNGDNGGNGSGASASSDGGSSATSGATGSGKPGSTSSTGDGLPVVPIAVGAVLALAVAGGVAVCSRKAARRR